MVRFFGRVGVDVDDSFGWDCQLRELQKELDGGKRNVGSVESRTKQRKADGGGK